MKKLLTILTLTSCLLWASFVLAGQGYDYRSGNTYNTMGSTTYGNNYNTGSQWNTTHNSGGNMQGMDAKGNAWSYDRGTGVYQNYGTGETRQNGKRSW